MSAKINTDDARSTRSSAAVDSAPPSPVREQVVETSLPSSPGVSPSSRRIVIEEEVVDAEPSMSPASMKSKKASVVVPKVPSLQQDPQSRTSSRMIAGAGSLYETDDDTDFIDDGAELEHTRQVKLMWQQIEKLRSGCQTARHDNGKILETHLAMQSLLEQQAAVVNEEQGKAAKFQGWVQDCIQNISQFQTNTFKSINNSTQSKWRTYTDPKTGRPYYHNIVTGEVSWKIPAGE